MVFIIVVESVYSAVRTDSLHKADYASSLKEVWASQQTVFLVFTPFVNV